MSKISVQRVEHILSYRDVIQSHSDTFNTCSFVFGDSEKCHFYRSWKFHSKIFEISSKLPTNDLIIYWELPRYYSFSLQVSAFAYRSQVSRNYFKEITSYLLTGDYYGKCVTGNQHQVTVPGNLLTCKRNSYQIFLNKKDEACF